jgi:endonuclease/exonuclease/phosphatase family metal-dependent hydrolase
LAILKTRLLVSTLEIIINKLVSTVVIALFLLYVLVDANTAVPGKALAGTSIDAPTRWSIPDADRFVVSTYNIRRSKGLDDKRDISRAAAVLRTAQADIVGLNELSGTLWYGRTNQAAQIGALLDFGWLFAPAYELLFQPYMGNGLVSRWPVSDWEVEPLITGDTESSSYRNMIVAAIPLKEKTLHVVITHLDRGPVRKRQLRQVIERFQQLPEPAILLGDLNTRADSPQIADLLSQSGVSDAIAVAPNCEERSVDWIISRGLKVLSCDMQERGVSDHPA